MKKILSISLLVVFLFQMAGYYFVFKIQQGEIRKEFKKLLQTGIADDKLIEIVFDKNFLPAKDDEIRFIDDHEILYRGTLYDIVRTEFHGTAISYFCCADHDETRLCAELSRIANDEMAKNSRQKKQIHNLKQLFGPFVFSLNRPEFGSFAADSFSKSKYHFSIQLWNTFPLTPPPKV